MTGRVLDVFLDAAQAVAVVVHAVVHVAPHAFDPRLQARLQAVDALGGDPDVGRDSDGVARVGFHEVDQASGLLGRLAGEIHIPGLEV